MNSFKYIILEEKNKTLWIKLNRPECFNALNLDMAREWKSAVLMAIKNTSYANIVITGEGDAFSSGGDIKLMSETKPAGHKKFFLTISKEINTMVMAMRESPKPILAAIPGYVGGISFGAVLGTDIRLASDKARLNAATIKIGLVANGGATYFLPRLIGLGRAAEMLLMGNVLNAQEAQLIGLVNRVFPHDQLFIETQKIADHLADSPQKALARVKKILHQSLTTSLPLQLERERQSIAWSSTTDDFREGIGAFVEKRKPTFNKTKKPK